MRDNGKFDQAARLVYDKRHALAGVKAAIAVAETIRELREVPAGTLYAALMERMNRETFEKLIDLLIGAGLVERDGSCRLRWIADKEGTC